MIALRRTVYLIDEMTGHGLRSMASTLLHEQGWNHHLTRKNRSLMASQNPSRRRAEPCRGTVIERQLAHADRTTCRRGL